MKKPTAYQSQTLWTATVAIIIAGLALYQVFGKPSDPSKASAVTRLDSRQPATLR